MIIQEFAERHGYTDTYELRRLAAIRDEAIKAAAEADQRLSTWADWYERHLVYHWPVSVDLEG